LNTLFCKKFRPFFCIFRFVTYHVGTEFPFSQISVMNTLKRFYRNILQNRVSYVSCTHDERFHVLELESHLATVMYDNFTLSDAVRPSLELTITPQSGYRYDKYPFGFKPPASFCRGGSRWQFPTLVASVSLENLFDVFLDLLNPLGSTVNVVLETSHYYSGAYHVGLDREYIDLPVLKSFLYDHEDLLLHDGCTGIVISAPAMRAEVKFDEHKLIYVCAKSLVPFERILRRYHIPRNDAMPLLTDAEHVHITRDEYLQHFRTLQVTLGMDESHTTVR